MAEKVVEIENLVKRYRELVALDHLCLSVEEGEIFGLLGPNGSGKTTAINCILSLLKFDKGSVRVFGEEMRPDNYRVKRQIGVAMQNADESVRAAADFVTGTNDSDGVASAIFRLGLV